MNQFVVILCLAFVSAAAAQNGYRYQQPIRQNAPTGSYRPPAPVVQQQLSNPIYSPVQSPPLSAQAPPVFSPLPQAPPAPQPILSAPPQSYLPPASAPVHQEQLSLPIQQPNFQSFQRPQTAIITKDIYIHSAPEDHEEAALGRQLTNLPVRKNYRIVFIKAPTQNLKLATDALKQAQTAQEEKTVIYVLSKKPDLSEVHQQLQQAQTQTKSHKPEVYFIKYKTQEEAQRAQQEIQAQYDALGGSTHISDEGIAPVTSVGSVNFSSTFGGSSYSQANQQQSYQAPNNFITAPSQRYLPAVKK